MRMPTNRLARLLPPCAFFGVLVALAGCATYQTPGAAAPIGAMTTGSIAERMNVQPESPIPATIAFSRIQASGYRSYSSSGTDRSSFSLVGPKDLEDDEHLAAIQSWNDVVAVVRLTPIVVPENPDAIMALREGAASLRADIIAVYTVDTEFDVDDRDIGALGIISLGLIPTRNAVVRSTISLAFFDVRTGFCFGTVEASAEDDQLANAWTSRQAIDDCRRRVERRAFDLMLVDAGGLWSKIAESRKSVSTAAR